MKRVYICSRYAGDIDHNVDVARRLCKLAADAGYAPFAPHLLYPQILDDTDPEARELGLSMGAEFMAVCSEVWLYGAEGVSEGMAREIRHAKDMGLFVHYVDRWEVER